MSFWSFAFLFCSSFLLWPKEDGGEKTNSNKKLVRIDREIKDASQASDFENKPETPLKPIDCRKFMVTQREIVVEDLNEKKRKKL
jgi:hypothetical protein